MAYDGDKRYVKIEFAPGKWQSEVKPDGVVEWTPLPGAGANVTITKIDGGEQPHADCAVGSKITTTHGTAVIHLV